MEHCADIAVFAAAGGAQAAYLNIPAASLRSFCDSCFPGLARDAAADSVRGAYHRWAAGHDIFVDIMPGFCHAPTEKLHQLGHVLLTDFPTRAGIPIPGCSGSGIGELLTSLGIHKGYLCLNIMDTGIGILAISDASRSLMAALAGDLPMNSWVAFDTFGGGAIEIAAGLGLRNPLLLFAGVEDALAGIISTWQTFTYHVNPLEFFGLSLGGFLLGGGIALALGASKPLPEKLRACLSAGGRSAVLGGLSSVSSAFSMGALLGFTAFELGRKAGVRSRSIWMSPELCRYLEECSMLHPSFADTWLKYLAYSGQNAAPPVWEHAAYSQAWKNYNAYVLSLDKAK